MAAAFDLDLVRRYCKPAAMSDGVKGPRRPIQTLGIRAVKEAVPPASDSLADDHH